MNSLIAAHDAAVQMIDTSIVRVHQHGGRIAGDNDKLTGQSRGGLTTKIHETGNGLLASLVSTTDATRIAPSASRILRQSIATVTFTR